MATTLDQLKNAVDPDSHEMIPMHMWPSFFGSAADDMFELVRSRTQHASSEANWDDGITGDNAAISESEIWTVKGTAAPGAIDISRRPAVLDAMGIQRQHIFPTFGLCGLVIASDPDAPVFWEFDPSIDFRSVGRAAVAAQNEWSAKIASSDLRHRIRAVSIVLCDSVAQMIRDATEAIKQGIRTLWIPIGKPIAGVSPASPSLDPFWDLCQRNDVAVVSHIGTEFGFVDARWYQDVAHFRPAKTSSVEFPIEPARAANINFAQENYLSAMILGGVFERFPDLRIGILESGAYWAGPLAEKLDMWAGEFRKRLDPVLSLQPSEYLARNVRVTPYVFEPVDLYFKRWPQLASIYCFSTDYPHIEGGRESKRVFFERLQRQGDEVIQKFFIENASLLLPEQAPAMPERTQLS